MKKIISSLLLLIPFVRSNAQKNHMPDMKVLERLNARFIHNFVTNDTASHSKIIHKDFVYISSNGEYVNRKKYLEDWAHGFNGISYWDYRDERISIFGNIALVRATNKMITQRDGKEILSMVMYTDVYIKESGQWLCVQAQISKVSPEFYPPDETIVKKYDFRNTNSNVIANTNSL